MAITIIKSENRAVLYGASFATHTFNVDIGDIVINDADDNKISDYAPTPSYGLVKYNTSANGRTWLIDGFDIKFYMLGTMIRKTYYSRGGNQIYTPANVEAQLPLKSNTSYWTYPNRTPSYYFNSTTKTTLSIPITYRLAYWAVQTGSDAIGTIANGYDDSESGDLGTFYLRLNVPPTFDNTALSIDTATAYTNITTASVTVSNATAYYGGDISSATLTIGNQTESISGNGTISILLNAGGTFTPTLSVTDSRGQVTTKSFDPITVNVYTAPSVNFDVGRTTSTGTPDDEGTYATIDATFTFADVIADAIAPTVTVTDEDGVQTTPTVTWYSSRGADGTLSGSVTWSSLSSGDTVHGLISNLNTEFSWQIAITPKDTAGTGTPITQMLAGAFYTIDFLAGGHGIAFGKPAINDGFECAMDATFEDTLTAQDMTQQEIDDFVDSIGGGGDPIADEVIEVGTSGIWTYRKWSSGIAECWGSYSSSITTSSPFGGWYYRTIGNIGFPSGLFSSTPTITATKNANANGLSFIQIYSVTSAGFTPEVANPTSQTFDCTIAFNAIGRWK